MTRIKFTYEAFGDRSVAFKREDLAADFRRRVAANGGKIISEERVSTADAVVAVVG
jgi:hypothetical protein